MWRLPDDTWRSGNVSCASHAVTRSSGRRRREYDKEGNALGTAQSGSGSNTSVSPVIGGLCQSSPARNSDSSLLIDIEEHSISNEEFLLRYFDAVKERYESPRSKRGTHRAT